MPIIARPWTHDNFQQPNSSLNRTKVILSSVLYFTPIIITFQFYNYNFQSETVNAIIVFLITCITLFTLYFNKNKILVDKWPIELKSNKVSGKLEKEVNSNKSRLNAFDTSFIRINTEIDELTKSVELNEESFYRKYEKLGKMVKTNSQKIFQIESSNIREEVKTPHKRDSPKREKAKTQIEKEFKLFLKDLETFSGYCKEQKSLKIERFELDEYKLYQILISFFKEFYSIPKGKYNPFIYNEFNKHFDGLKNNPLNKGNWTHYAKTYVQNEKLKEIDLYQDLKLELKKRSTVE